MRRAPWLLALALSAAPVKASADPQSNPATSPDTNGEAKGPPAPADSQAAPPLWGAEISGGYARRDSGPSGAFAVAALSRRIERLYVRAAFTAYRSTIQQADTALPSAYTVGSLGTGGNFNNWVFDVWGSWGWQHYGAISTSRGTRGSTARSGSPYLSLGFDAGRIFSLGKGLYLTPTLGGTFVHDRLLRPSPDVYHWPDYESDEKAWTGLAAVRLDKTFGGQRQHYAGVGLSWHVTSNGMSVLVPPFETPGGRFSTRSLPDGWGEVTANAGLRINQRLRFEVTASRSFQALAGNATTVSGGLRVNF